MHVVAAIRARKVVPRPAGVVLAIALLAVSNVLVNRVLPGWVYPWWNAGIAAALVLLALGCGVSRERLGLRNDTLRRAVLVGLVGMACVALVYAIALAVPTWRAAFDDRRATGLGTGALLWDVLIRIPIGTVLLEEVAFRGVLPALLGGDERWRWGPVLASSGLFGLWHVLPSLRLTSDNQAVRDLFGSASPLVTPLLAVISTTIAGVGLCAWRYAGRGLLAPMLVHLATNSGGLVLAWWLRH